MEITSISQNMFIIYSICSLLSMVLSVICLITSIVAVIKVIAMEKSTHQVTYMPIDEQIDKENQDFMKQWATDEDSLSVQQKVYKEDLEDLMPEFAPQDDDKKIHSF